MDIVDIDTPHGPAKAHLDLADAPVAALVLGHGAAGSVTAPDLVAASDAARSAGLGVVLVEQPYRVAGRRSAAPAHQLDAAWIAVVEQLRDGELGDLPLIAGGRSSGARVACRTAAETGAIGVLCLAFPLHPPGRPGEDAAVRARGSAGPGADRAGHVGPVRYAARRLRTAPSSPCPATTASRPISPRSATRCATGSRKYRPSQVRTVPVAADHRLTHPVTGHVQPAHHRITVRRQPAPATTGDRTYFRTPVLVAPAQ